jgi:hypothetical protein
LYYIKSLFTIFLTPQLLYICGKIKRISGKKSREVKPLKFYVTMALPCLMYGSETWALRTDETRLGASDMRFLRHVAGYTVWEKERSDEIRSQQGMRKLEKQIHERKQNWPEHL